MVPLLRARKIQPAAMGVEKRHGECVRRNYPGFIAAPSWPPGLAKGTETLIDLSGDQAIGFNQITARQSTSFVAASRSLVEQLAATLPNPLGAKRPDQAAPKGPRVGDFGNAVPSGRRTSWNRRSTHGFHSLGGTRVRVSTARPGRGFTMLPGEAVLPQRRLSPAFIRTTSARGGARPAAIAGTIWVHPFSSWGLPVRIAIVPAWISPSTPRGFRSIGGG
jgi:hypothetical protein